MTVSSLPTPVVPAAKGSASARGGRPDSAPAAAEDFAAALASAGSRVSGRAADDQAADRAVSNRALSGRAAAGQAADRAAADQAADRAAADRAAADRAAARSKSRDRTRSGPADRPVREPARETDRDVVSRAAEKPADSDSADRRSSEVNSGKENPADQTSAQDPALADQGTDGATGTVLSGADAKAAQALALAAAVTGPGSAAEATGTGLAGEQPGVPDASVSAVGISAVGVPAITKTTGPEVAGTQTATAQVGGDQAAGTQTVSNQAGPASGSAAGDGAAGNGAAGSGGNTGAGDGSATGTSTDASGGAGKSGATPGAGPVAGGAQAAATGTAVNIAIPVTRQGNGQVVADATTKVDQAASVAGSDADPVGIAAPATLAPNSLASAPTAERVAGATPPPVVEQVVNRLSMLRSGPDGTHKLTMRLDPVELGPIKIIAEVREGSLKLELIAAVPAAQDTLRQAMGELRRELANAGFSSATVNVQQGGPDSGAAQTSSNGLTGGSGGSGNGQPSGDRPGWTSTGTGWAAPETDHQAVRLGAGGRSAVDVRV